MKKALALVYRVTGSQQVNCDENYLLGEDRKMNLSDLLRTTRQHLKVCY